MNNKFLVKAAAAAAVIGLTAIATPAVAAEAIAGKGSSFANGALQYCLAHFDPASNDTVTYTSTGSGTGRSEFAKGTVDWAATDGTYGSADSQPASYVTVPLLGGPVVFAYNKSSGIPANLKLDAATISGILKGTIAKWDDAAIKKLNPGKKLPAKAILTFYRDASGTTENLTNYLLQNVPSAGWTKSKDLTAQIKTNASATVKATSSVLADKVQNTKYAFGYFDLSDAVTAKVAYAALKNANGDFVVPTAAAGAKFLAGQTTVVDSSSMRTDGTLTIDFTKKIKNAYQLTIVTYGLAPKGGTNAKAAAVEGWFKYVVNTCMPTKAASLGYVALPSKLKTAALAQIATISDK
jgi:phosphate transport system substrate-binding protein